MYTYFLIDPPKIVQFLLTKCIILSHTPIKKHKIVKIIYNLGPPPPS